MGHDLRGQKRVLTGVERVDIPDRECPETSINPQTHNKRDDRLRKAEPV
jgi:hypothetical protein